MNFFTKKIWSDIKRVYFYKKYYYNVKERHTELMSTIPNILMENSRIYLHSGKEGSLYKIREEISGYKYGDIIQTRKYRPAKYRKSKKKK